MISKVVVVVVDVDKVDFERAFSKKQKIYHGGVWQVEACCLKQEKKSRTALLPSDCTFECFPLLYKHPPPG